MKSTSAALAQHIDQECTTLSMCVKLTLVKYQPRILRITQSDPAVVQTLWPHGYVDGDVVRIFGVRGMTELNGNEYPVLRIDDFFFEINVDTTLLSLYQGKGEARRVIAFTDHIRDLVLPINV